MQNLRTKNVYWERKKKIILKIGKETFEKTLLEEKWERKGSSRFENGRK